MSEQVLGIIGKSAAKLATEKTELEASLLADLKDYVDGELGAKAILGEKLIEGKVKNFSLPVGITEVKDYLLYNVPTLKSVDIVNCTYLGEKALAKCYYVEDIDTSEAKIKNLGVGAFSLVGCDRDRPDLNLITIDLRKSEFKFVGKHTFGSDDIDHKMRYAEIYLPKTVTQVANYAFQNAEHCNIYFSGDAPQLLGSTVFNGATDCKLFVSWRGLYGYKHNTNWSALTTVGYGQEIDFENGDTLPAYTQDGYELSWFEDEDLLIPATTADGTSHYYCSVGSTKMANQVFTRIENCDVEIKDSSDNIYDEDHPIPYGVEVTITVTPKTGFSSKFLLTVNGTNIDSGDTFTSTDGGSALQLVALYYDGVHAPISPVIGDNSPAVIASVVADGKALQYWNLGDELDITLTDNTVQTFVLVDGKTGRYNYSQSNKKTNAVFMSKKVIQESQMNTTGTNVGGFAASAMNTTHLPAIYNKFPEEWKRVIPEIEVKGSYSGTSSELATATCHLFLPSGYELTGGSFNGRGEEIDDIFGYYVGKTNNSDRIKYNSSNTAKNWWLRSPRSGDTSYFVGVSASGAAGSNYANNSFGVVPCFCL